MVLLQHVPHVPLDELALRDVVRSANAQLDVDEEVVDELLDVGAAEGRREGAESDREEPDVESRDGEPGLEGWGEGALCRGESR
mgnify:FL=1